MEFQKEVDKFIKDNNINNPIENRMLDLVSEIGEVSKEINKMSCYGKEKLKFREEIRNEIGDVFYSLITVANYYNIDMLEALEIVMKKYKKRAEKGRGCGSEND